MNNILTKTLTMIYLVLFGIPAYIIGVILGILIGPPLRIFFSTYREKSEHFSNYLYGKMLVLENKQTSLIKNAPINSPLINTKDKDVVDKINEIMKKRKN